MPQVKHFTAKKDFTLDCGHRVKAGEKFVVTSIFSCVNDEQLPAQILRAAFKNAIVTLYKEIPKSWLPKEVTQK